MKVRIKTRANEKRRRTTIGKGEIEQRGGSEIEQGSRGGKIMDKKKQRNEDVKKKEKTREEEEK
jgi:hypothetical protein